MADDEGYTGGGSSQPSQDRRLRRAGRVRTWVVGAVVASLGLALTGALTGLFTDVGRRILPDLDKPNPLNVTSTSDVEPCGRGWVIPMHSSAIPPPPPLAQSRAGWADQLRGVPALGRRVRVVVTGRTASAVVLTDLRIIVLTRDPPVAGTQVIGICGGAVATRYFVVDLDPALPTVEARPSDFDQPPVAFPYRVSSTEPEVFLIDARTRNCFCSWIAELHWVADGREGITRIDDKGRPFHVTATSSVLRSSSLMKASRYNHTARIDPRLPLPIGPRARTIRSAVVQPILGQAVTAQATCTASAVVKCFAAAQCVAERPMIGNHSWTAPLARTAVRNALALVRA